MVVQFTTTIKRFQQQAEKTGWTYIEIPVALGEKLMPGNKKGFRVKGYLDDYAFSGISLLPMGRGNFILTLNGTVRKKIRKTKGDKVNVKMEVDLKPLLPPSELMECLEDEPEALARFKDLTKSHQNYFTNWIKSAKTEPTKAKRIAASVNALAAGFGFVEAYRSLKRNKIDNNY
jgi:hypothetical protein